MHISDNERYLLETIRDECFATISQLAHACDMPYMMCLHLVRGLSLGGLIDGFELTYAGHKVLNGEAMKSSDFDMNVDVRIADIKRDSF